LAFAGVWFFGILAPTSTFVPLRDLLVEHRMYLPLAAVITLVVLGVHRLLSVVVLPERRRLAAGGLAALAIAGLSVRTWDRNTDYHSELEVWGPAVAQRPDNTKRIYNLGLEFMLAERGLLEPATFSLSIDVDGAPAAVRAGVAAMQRGVSQPSGTWSWQSKPHKPEIPRCRPIFSVDWASPVSSWEMCPGLSTI
jgi:hypothetical protein